MAVRATYNGGILESSGIGVGAIPTYYFFSPMGLCTQGFLYAPGDIWWNNDPYITEDAVWANAEEDQAASWSDAEEVQSVVWAECECLPGCD